MNIHFAYKERYIFIAVGVVVRNYVENMRKKSNREENAAEKIVEKQPGEGKEMIVR